MRLSEIMQASGFGLPLALACWLSGHLAFAQDHACSGDCDGDGVVAIQEIVVGINIALGTRESSACRAFDGDGSGTVTVDELLRALRSALDGCPATPTPLATPTPTYSGPTVFTDAAESAGVALDKEQLRQPPDCLQPPLRPESPISGLECSPENFAGGATVGDADGDGLADLYVTRIYKPDALFRNRGDGTFEDITSFAGLGRLVQSNGAAFGDVDNDGDLDLYVSTIGETSNLLYINDGEGHFTEDAARRGAAVDTGGPHFAMGVAIGDYDRDGWIDIYTTEWVQYFGAPPFPPSHSRLLRNMGSEAPGHFEDVTQSAGVAPPIHDGNLPGPRTFSPAFVDLDRDGWQDLAIASDTGTTQLFWNNRDGTFTDGVQQSGLRTSSADMGSTFGDYDNDGDLDWFITGLSCQPPFELNPSQDWPCGGNVLLRNNGNRTFSDEARSMGVAVGHWGWGAAFLDYDNDGDLDLGMTNGMRLPGSVDAVFTEPYHADPNRFWRNDGGSMTDIADEVGFNDTGLGKGLLVFDYDNDGDLDIFVANSNAPPRLYRNEGGNRNRWLRVETRGTVSNREGRGAVVTLRATRDDPTQLREIGAGSHFLGESERTAHFGLGSGDEPVYEVRVEWPRSGAVEILSDVAVNQTIVVSEPPADRRR